MAASSILDSVKKVLGIDAAYTAFDLDVTIHINSAFGTLHQLGVGPAEPFMIDFDNPAEATWDDFLGGQTNINQVRTYVYLAVRLVFDPPDTSFVLAAMERQKTELEWRLNVASESSTTGSGGGSSNASLWDVTGQPDFPPEAEVGDLGVDLVTGDVWRNE